MLPGPEKKRDEDERVLGKWPLPPHDGARAAAAVHASVALAEAVRGDGSTSGDGHAIPGVLR